MTKKFLSAEEVSTVDMTLGMARVEIGPMVLYRYRATFRPTGTRMDWWMLCPMGGPTIGGHLPRFLDAPLQRWVDRRLKSAAGDCAERRKA